MAAADPSAYVELHVHSCWSLREGASSCDELIDRALELGYPALALTDHDNLYGGDGVRSHCPRARAPADQRS